METETTSEFHNVGTAFAEHILASKIEMTPKEQNCD